MVSNASGGRLPHVDNMHSWQRMARIMDGVVVLELVGAAHMAMASIRQVH